MIAVSNYSQLVEVIVQETTAEDLVVVAECNCSPDALYCSGRPEYFEDVYIWWPSNGCTMQPTGRSTGECTGMEGMCSMFGTAMA